MPPGGRNHALVSGDERWHHRCVARKKVSTTVYLTEEQDEFLKALSSKTNVPAAAYIREGVEFVMAKHRKVLSAQEELSLGITNEGVGGE